jgi:hypothetical protein
VCGRGGGVRRSFVVETVQLKGNLAHQEPRALPRTTVGLYFLLKDYQVGRGASP